MPKKRKSSPRSKSLLLFLLFILCLSIALLITIYQKRSPSSLSINQLTETLTFPDIDPQTHEFYDFWITTEVSTINNNVTQTAFTIGGPRLANTTSLYGFKQTSEEPLGPDLINFTYNPNNHLWDRFIATANLTHNNCIDFHSSSSPNRENYIATACYRNTFIAPNDTNKTVYGASGNFFIQLSYQGTTNTSIQFFSTAFDKYVSKPVGYENGPIMTRVSRIITDYNSSSLSDFYNVIYTVTGLGGGLDPNGYRQLCSDPNNPQKYIKFTSSNPKPDGGSNYIVSRKTGACSFELDNNTLIPFYMSLWVEGGVPLPNPTPTPTPLPTPTPTPTPTPSATPLPNQSPKIQTTTLPSGALKQTYRTSAVAIDPDANNPKNRTRVFATGLPTGLSLTNCTYTYTAPTARTTCQITGQPKVTGKLPVTLVAVDYMGARASTTLSLVINRNAITPIDPQPTPLAE